MELQILHWFESLHNPVTDPVMYAITCLGNAGIFWILLCAAFLFIPVFKKDRKLGLSMAIGLILSLIMCNGIMKNLSARIRPFNADPTFENLYGIFNGIKDRKKGIPAVILAALIAVSRLYLTVHYPTDVLASLLLGSLYGVIGYFVTKLIMKRSEKARKVFSGEEPYKKLFAKA